MVFLLNEFNRRSVGFERRKLERREDELAAVCERGVRNAGEDPYFHMVAAISEVEADGDGERTHES